MRMKAEKNREKVGFMNDLFQVSSAVSSPGMKIRQVYLGSGFRPNSLKATDLYATKKGIINPVEVK